MKSYKDFAKESIGSSDIGALVLVGGKGGLESMMMMERLLKRVLLRLTCIVPEILAVLSRRCSRSASAVLLGCCSLNSGARPEAPPLRYRLTV